MSILSSNSSTVEQPRSNLLLDSSAAGDDALLAVGAENETAPPPPTLPKTTAEAIAFIIDDYNAMKARKKGEWYLLEPGDPFYEDYEPFPAVNDAGTAEVTNFVQYYAQDGALISPAPKWSDVRPKRISDARMRHFRRTPNELLIGRDGTLVVSAGTWGSRELPDGGFEYLPIDQYRAWRTEFERTDPRTVNNRPYWAEECEPFPTSWKRIDYSVSRGPFTYKQRLEHDDVMREPSGWASGKFSTPADLREMASCALELAELLERRHDDA